MQEKETEVKDTEIARVERNVNVLSWILSWIYAPMYACGHRDVHVFALNFHGRIIKMKLRHLLKREKCGDCRIAELEKIAARCVLCDNVILPGDAIRLCDVREDQPSYATIVQTPHGLCAVGCMGIDCAEDGLAYCGNWSAEGVHLPKAVEHKHCTEIKPDMKGELYPRAECIIV